MLGVVAELRWQRTEQLAERLERCFHETSVFGSEYDLNILADVSSSTQLLLVCYEDKQHSCREQASEKQKVHIYTYIWKNP